MQVENYYEEEIPKENGFSQKQILLIVSGIIILFLVIGFFLFTPQTNPNEINIDSEEQTNIGFSGSLIIDDEVIDTFSSEGRTLTQKANPSESRTITMKINNSNTKFNNGKVVIKDSSGKIVGEIPPEFVTITEDGEISFNINFPELGIDPDLIGTNETDEEGNPIYEFNFEIVVTDDTETEVLTIEVPYQVQFEEFIGTGCLLLSRGSVTQSTHFGELIIPLKIRTICGDTENLEASVSWSGNKVHGNVEVIFDNGRGSLITPNNTLLKENPQIGDYEAKIHYVPKPSSKGETSKFNLDFKLGNSTKNISFNVLNENLEQCISVTTLDSQILDETDTASIEIDSSKCNSSVNIYLCDADYGCSGGTVEGSINLSKGFFTLSKNNPKKIIDISKNDIPGIYGVTVHASTPGINKVFISEEEIFVKPTYEIFNLNKYSVSMLDGTRDTIRISHNELSENIEIDAGVCELYESSTGAAPGNNGVMNSFSNDESWVGDLYNNSDRYAGKGFYQTAFGKTLPYIDSARRSAQLKASFENEKIKAGYLLVNSDNEELENVITNGEISSEDLDELQSAIDDTINIGDADVAISMISIASTLASVVSSMRTDCTQLEAINIEAETYFTAASIQISNCASAPNQLETYKIPANNALLAATATCESTLLEIIEIYDTFNALKSSYELIENMVSETKEMDVESSKENLNSANELVMEAKNDSDEAVRLISLALKEISFDSFSESSNDALKAKNYLEQALAKNNSAKDKLQQASTTTLKSGEDLTQTIPDKMETWEEVNAYISSVEGLIKLIATSVGKLTTIGAELKIATTQITSLQKLIAADISTCTTQCGGTLTIDQSACSQATASGATEGLGVTLLSSIEKENTSLVRTASTLGVVSATLGTLQSSLELYNASLNEDISKAYTNASGSIDEFLNSINDSLLLLSTTKEYLELAIESAQNIKSWVNIPSTLTDYDNEFNLPSEFGEYDKERMNGIISSFILSGFVSGAYDGGVYTTQNTNPTGYGTTVTAKEKETFKKISFSEELTEKCDNRVNLILPDYKINLLQDAKPIESSNDGVIANWAFNNSKMFGFYEEQEVGVILANNGITENGYTTLTISATKHEHDPYTITESEFGPFNIPDSRVIDVEEKFHIKVNVKPRIDYSNNSDATCEKGLFIGDTTSSALPKIILGWDFEDITSKTTKGKYLDAAQFSILLSKKMTVLNDFLANAQVSCPENYPFISLTNMLHPDLSLTQTPDCFLPLTTKYYDGKPALYYHLNQSAFVPEYYDDFFDEEPISNAEEMLEIIDFNTLLIKDGYGLELQSDFSHYYSQSFLKATPGFTNTRNGMYTYFKNPKKFYYTNETKDFLSDQDFIIPDAGLYDIRIIADFDSLPLINGGVPQAEVYVEMNLKEPIKENYSPFYYTPFDGGVGMRVKNDRRYYGTSTNFGDLKISHDDAIEINDEQKDSLKKLNLLKVKDIFKANSYASNRAKILDYSISKDGYVIWSPTIATPLLFSLEADFEEESSMFYWIKQNEKDLSAQTNNLFLLNAITGCKDFFGDLMTSYLDETPDTKIGLNYGFGFPPAKESGKIYTYTMAYSPVEDSFALAFPENMSIRTTNQIERAGLIPLEGIKGMSYNDMSNHDYITSIGALFNAVENESVCVARSGEREIYYWSEKYLYERENNNGKKLITHINQAKADCIN